MDNAIYKRIEDYIEEHYRLKVAEKLGVTGLFVLHKKPSLFRRIFKKGGK